MSRTRKAINYGIAALIVTAIVAAFRKLTTSDASPVPTEA